MWTQQIKDLKADYFDLFHSDKPQYIKDTFLQSIHEQIGELDRENQKLWEDSQAKAGDIDSVIEYWKKINNIT